MSDNSLALFSKDKLPAYLKNIGLDDTTKALMGGGGGKRISIRGGVFRKVVGGKEVMKNEDRSMNVVIVRSSPHVVRTYYKGTYVEGSNAAPDCWASDGEKPDSDVKEPQSSACVTCPMNVAGSGQGESRACRFSQRLAIALDGDLEGDIMQLSLPAQSLFGKGEGGLMPLQQYVKFLAGHQVPVTAVVTEMKFDTDSATPKLTFKPVRPLTEEEYAICKEQSESSDAIDAITFTVGKIDGAVSAGTAEDAAALKGAIKEDPPADAEPPKRKRRTKAEIEAAAEAALAAEEAAEAAAKKAAEDDAAKAAAGDPDEDDEDDEEAALLKQMAALKAKKAAAKAAAEKAAADGDDDPEPTVRSGKSDAAAGTKTAADVMAAWANDTDD